MKLLSLFSGIGAFEKALENIGVDYKLVGFSEIDKWAIESYCAIHDVGKELNLGDVGEIKSEDIPKADIVTYGFPCQDVSIAGNLKGINKNTRSGLLYEAERIIEYIKPKYAIAENVKNLVGKRFREDFEQLLERLDNYGYNNYWKVLNAKDYGIPQNRERVFIVSIRKDIDDGNFKFPEPIELNLKLRDMLEDKAEDKYTVSRDRYRKILNSNFNQERAMLQDTSKVCSTLLARDYKDPKIVKVKETTQTLDTQCNQAALERYYFPKGHREYSNYDKTKVNKEITKVNPIQVGNSTKFGNAVSNEEYAYTIRASNPNGILDENYRIRKLTPLECWRLMGFEDKDYWVARRRLEEVFYNGNDRSNSQMYKQAGNSIVVDVLEAIFVELFRIK